MIIIALSGAALAACPNVNVTDVDGTVHVMRNSLYAVDASYGGATVPGEIAGQTVNFGTDYPNVGCDLRIVDIEWEASTWDFRNKIWGSYDTAIELRDAMTGFTFGYLYPVSASHCRWDGLYLYDCAFDSLDAPFDVFAGYGFNVEFMYDASFASAVLDDVLLAHLLTVTYTDGLDTVTVGLYLNGKKWGF